MYTVTVYNMFPATGPQLETEIEYGQRRIAAFEEFYEQIKLNQERGQERIQILLKAGTKIIASFRIK